MTDIERNGAGGWRHWRPVLWGGAALLLLIPLAVGAPWSATDYLFAGTLLFGSLGAYEVATRLAAGSAYRTGAAVAIVGSLLLIWISGAVGITDSDADLLLVLSLPAVALIGAIVARFRPRGLALAMFATALAQAATATGALIAGVVPPHNSAIEILGLTGFFVALFVGAGLLFRQAEEEGVRRDAA